jgi:hypothetical protein
MVLLASFLFLFLCIESAASQGTTEDRFSHQMRKALKTWTGDWDGMVTRNQGRVLVPFIKPFYFLDGGRQRGITYDLMKEFKNQLKIEKTFMDQYRNSLRALAN